MEILKKYLRRPDIPRQLEREVLLEAGHRCAIPTCRQIPVEIVHIIPWEKVREHKFDNLIALCPTCHTRYHNGNIDRKSLLMYKANLSILNGRYGDLEKRVLRLFSEQSAAKQVWLPGGFDILLLYLINDGLIVDTGQNSGIFMAGVPSAKLYEITDKGREFITRWISAKELE